MRRVVLISLLPLCAVGARHLAEWLVLGPAQTRASAALVLASRADQLDLVLRMPAADRRSVVARMLEELGHAHSAPQQAAPGELAAGLRDCLGDARGCAAGRRALVRARQQAAARLRRLELVRVGVAGGAGLVLLVCGALAARQAWGRRRAALGLALAGALLGLGGGVRLVHQAMGDAAAARREASRDRWITRARLAMHLPPGQRQTELARVVSGLRRLGVEVDRLRAGVASCAADVCPPDRVLVPLARVYGAAPDVAGRRGWLERWLLWLGAAALALVPPAGLGRRP